MNTGHQHINGSVDPEQAAVNADIIAGDNTPFLIGIIVIISSSVLVSIADSFLRFVLSDLIPGHNVGETVRLIRMNEYGQYILLLLQNKIRAASDNNRGSGLADFLNRLKL